MDNLCRKTFPILYSANKNGIHIIWALMLRSNFLHFKSIHRMRSLEFTNIKKKRANFVRTGSNRRNSRELIKNGYSNRSAVLPNAYKLLSMCWVWLWSFHLVLLRMYMAFGVFRFYFYSFLHKATYDFVLLIRSDRSDMYTEIPLVNILRFFIVLCTGCSNSYLWNSWS